MSVFEYKLTRAIDGKPGSTTHTIEADYYETEYNPNSELHEFVFFKDGKRVLIIPTHWVPERIREIG